MRTTFGASARASDAIELAHFVLIGKNGSAHAANKLTGDPNSDSAFLSSGELLSKAQELGGLVGINVVKIAHKPVNPTSSIAIKVTMQDINLFNGKVPTLPNSSTGAALIGQTSHFTHYATINFTQIQQGGKQNVGAPSLRTLRLHAVQGQMSFRRTDSSLALNYLSGRCQIPGCWAG